MGVRNESVRLSLDDAGFSTGMARAAAATALLQRELNEVDGIGVRVHQTLPTVGDDVDRVGRSSRSAGPEIDRLSGRLAIMAKAAAVLGPGLVPIGAVAIPAVAGLASQFGFAAIGAGSLVVAAQGVGDALKAVNEAALKPTAANVEKARLAMSQIGPEAQRFVKHFQKIRPVLSDIRDAAARGWFPGLTESLDSLEQVAPRVASLFETIGRTGGNLVAEGAQALTGPQWSEFMSFVENNAPQALEDLGRVVGNVATGLGELWMAFDPLNDDFSTWMVKASQGFSDWAAGLSQTEGFQEFVAYVRENGPRVGDALVAISNAVLQIVEAAAPMGGPVLDGITAFANAVAAIADSPLGTPIMAAVTALSAMSLAANVANASVMRLNASMATLGLTSKAASTGGALAAGSRGGPFGLAAVATIVGVTNSIQNAKKSLSGEQSPWEGLLRSVVPAIPLMEDLGLSFWKTDEAADAAASSTDQFASSQAALSPALAQAAHQSGRTRSAVAGLAAAMDQSVESALAAFDAETQWRQALKAAQQQAGKTSAGIRGNSDAAIQNRQMLSQLAAAWNNQSDAVRNNIGRFRAARKAFIDTAVAMGVPIGRARALAQALLSIPEKRKVDVLVNTQGAISAVQFLKNELAGVRSKTVTVTVNGKKTGASVGTPGSGLGALLGGSADGSTVPKDGGPYADRYPYLLAPGEEVISNRYGQADRHRELLKAINAGRLADGGTVGLADGGTARRLPALGFADLPAINLATASLKALRQAAHGAEKAFARSEKALDKETKERDAVRDSLNSLASDVSGKLRSDLFGRETNPWNSASLGGSFDDILATLKGDIATGTAFKSDVAALKAKGLAGSPSLNALLAGASPEQVAMFADLSKAQLAQYDRLFKVRESVTGSAGVSAGNAVFGAELKKQTREMQHAARQRDRLEARVKHLERTIAREEKETRASHKRGTGSGSRNRKRG